VTLHRFPEGVTGPHFFQTRCPPHPEWLRTAMLSYERTGKSFDVAVLDDRPSLVWAANLAAIEIHPFLSPADAFDQPSWVVVDLDPGPPADLLDAAEVALHTRDHLAAAGLQPVVKTSGGKGLHVYARVPLGASYDDTKAIAHALATGLEQRRPDRVVSSMAKARRPGRVLVDWSQNDPGKSTVAPYSLRGLARPSVSTPLGWAEVEELLRLRDPRRVMFTPDEVLERVAELGDLFAGALEG
jgi:bifunctional non-homologous end joining protein LigD